MRKIIAIVLLFGFSALAADYQLDRHLPRVVKDSCKEAFEDELPDDVFVLVTFGETPSGSDAHMYLREHEFGGFYFEIVFSKSVAWRKRPALAGWCAYSLSRFIRASIQGIPNVSND